jgi:intein/homing endonuclease
MAKKLTIFQRLNTVLGATKGSEPSYVIDPKSFANLDASELQQKKLEAQQTFYLQNQWKKIDNELYQKAVYYEPTRMASYYDYEAMEYSISADTKIATPDGFITIKELADKGRDYEFITYAYDHNLKKVVPAKAKNAHYTRDEMTYKITFDDGSHIIATYGHRFLKRNGIFCEVENLKVGDSMMPFYRKSFYNNQKYNWVYTCNSNEGYNGWVAEHNLIAKWFDRTINENEEVHHIDFNGKNNPAYIKLPFDNIVESAKINRTLFKTAKSLNISYKKIQKELKFNGFKNWFDFLDVYNIPKYVPGVEDRGALNFNVIPWDLLIEVAKSKKTMQATSDYLGIGLPKLRSTIRSGGFNNWRTFLSAYGITGGKPGRKKITEDIVVNHKIVSIEPHGVIPVYDLTVPGYKNFATDTIFSHNTPEISVALDIFADEATTSNESGRILSIYSESTRIKNELINLFDNVLDINTNLTAWARNLCKYGDNFVYNKIVPKKGIVGCLQLPNIEMTRTEPGFTPVRNMDAYNEENSTQFHWKDKNIEFNSFEVSHFRLTGDDRKLPYGTCLKYDTRVDVENGVKEIKDIQIGDKVWSFDIKTQKRVLSPVLDVINSKFKINYAINTKHNFIEASKEHRIMIFNGNDFIYKNVLDINIGDLLVINKNVVNSENNSYNNQMIKYDNPNRISDEYILEPVTKIVETGNFETYDIYVENENHNFYANGIVVHNSMLEKVRRIWKQLLLSEDAMLVYRVTRAPERRVYKVFVGNMDDKDVDAYVDKIANSFKRTNVVNSDNGQQDTRYNALAVDQDYFIPVRDPGLAMPIETLPGAQNLSEIADIEYIQKKMLAALRVPKAFLGFDESTGDGKNLAILDIRFARAVHRVQKALIQELNKMAIIHLYLKGYEDDLDNFTLSLTTPSTQAEILKVENWKEKIQLYRDAVTDAGNGYGATSMTWAKKEILGMSEDEIKLDIQRQAVEKAGGEEIKMLAETIKQTGMFREIYKAYKINPENMSAGEQQPTDGGAESGGSFGGGGGGDLGGDLGGEGDLGGDLGAEGGGDDLATDFTTPLEEPEPLSETVKKNNKKRRNNITERLNKTINDLDKLINE